jgi:pimeloyl-ACP methyl ester carboxylesterase
MRTRSVLATVLVLVLLAAGCSSEGAGDNASHPAASSPTQPPASSGSRDDGEIGASFQVRDYDLHLSCLGDHQPGSPTVVYLHGLGGDGGDVQEALSPELARHARLCTYDRVNVGLSGRSTERHTGADSVEDLHTLLAAAEVRAPYLLLGFSFGGLIAAMYAATYPADVMGLLLLDASLPTDAEVDALIPAAFRKQVISEQQANAERVDFYTTLEEADALMDSVPDVPMTYLAARPVDLPPQWPVERMRRRIAANQREFADLFPQGRLVPVQSSHDIDLEKPKLVIAEVDRILDS